ncbi:MAG TPA: hypothetical protein VJ840_18440 [Gemmatimonadaceae bacterium]|nr:hypothetical protein [Gemmatimonadaceae bacterium]
MIARIWHGWTTPQNATRYAKHATETVFPALARIHGFRGGVLLQHDDQDEVEFIVQTLWDSLKAVREFAGTDPDVAVVEPAARKVLSRFDEYVRHYELNGAIGEAFRPLIAGNAPTEAGDDASQADGSAA